MVIYITGSASIQNNHLKQVKTTATPLLQNAANHQTIDAQQTTSGLHSIPAFYTKQDTRFSKPINVANLTKNPQQAYKNSSQKPCKTAENPHQA
jgi:hypothetical protein